MFESLYVTPKEEKRFRVFGNKLFRAIYTYKADKLAVRTVRHLQTLEIRDLSFHLLFLNNKTKKNHISSTCNRETEII